MASNPTPTEIIPAPIPRKLRALIGDIFMKAADIDHLISMALFKAASIHETNGFILLARMDLSERIKRLKFFIEQYPDDAMRLAYQKISLKLNNFITSRNYIAHGVYIGYNRECRMYCFMKYSDYEDLDENGAFITKAKTFSEDEIISLVSDGNWIDANIRAGFGIKPLHEKFKPRHFRQKPQSRKALRKNMKSESQPPRRSSRE